MNTLFSLQPEGMGEPTAAVPAGQRSRAESGGGGESGPGRAQGRSPAMISQRCAKR